MSNRKLSPRYQASAVSFAAELRRAMRAQAVSNTDLARAIGSTATSVATYRSGGILPKLETAVRMADALMWPNLVALTRAARTRTCVVCGTSFVFQMAKRRYCSSACNRVGWIAGGRIVRPDERQLAIAEKCRTSCPESNGEVCRDETCPLRPFSPLPLGSHIAVAYVGDPEKAATRAVWRARWRARMARQKERQEHTA